MTASPSTAAPEPSPVVLEVEKSLLGSILICGRGWLAKADGLDRRDFGYEPHRLIWDAICELDADGEGIDLVTVMYRLERKGTLDRAGGAGYESSLVDRVPDVENVAAYARIIREASLMRRRRAWGT